MSIYAKLQKASDLLEINDLQGARDLLKQIAIKAQKNIAFKQTYARLLNKEGKTKKAIQLLEEVVLKQRNNFDALNSLGLAYLANKQIDEAENSFLKCIELKPNYAYGLSNLGIIYFEKGLYEKAIQYCEKALAHNDKLYHARNCMGISYYKMGDFESAKRVLSDSISNYEVNPEGYIYLLNVIFSEQNLEEVNYFIERALRSPYLNNLDKLEFLTVYLISSWLLSNFQKSIDIMGQMCKIIRLEDTKNSHSLKDKKGFVNSIRHANEFRLKYPDLYSDDNQLEKIFFICESHCLAANNLKIHFKHSDYKIESRFIRGCKIFHLSSDKLNDYQQSITILSKQLPKESSIICGFGEIDCRLDEGIYAAYERKHIPVEENINKMIPKYLNLVKQLFGKHKQIFIYGVPAPNPNIFKNTEEDKKIKFIDMIAHLNQELKTGCQERNFLFLDIYSETNDNGISNMKYHYDWHHVTPAVIQTLFNKL